MKKYAIFALAAVLIAATLTSCLTKLPLNESSAPETESSAQPTESSAPESETEESSVPAPESAPESEEESVDESSAPEATSEEPGESSEEISDEESSEISEEPSEASDEESSEESSEPAAKIGELTAPYISRIDSGKYSIRISETRTVGGEALPYTVTAYHKNKAIYYEIEESYGSKVTYLRKGGKLITLDEFLKTALVMDDDGEVFEKKLWTGDIRLTGSGTEQLFDTDYSYEKYVDSKGFEFTLFYNLNGELERYRSYDSSVKDTIVISVSISSDISGGVFDIPSGYTVVEE